MIIPLIESKSKFHCCDFLSFNDMNEGVFLASKKDHDVLLKKKKQYKICSFSTKSALSSQLMWGHYANAGMGVAIELEVQDSSNIEPITYDDNMPSFGDVRGILTRKSKVWEYESEVRYLSNEETEDKVKIGTITKVYFGMPYKDLKNYNNIETEHTTLKRYLEYKTELKNICEKQKIKCEDYYFNK
ncbi:hypothetical protein SPBRAN_187 [uncultured Candidatus Thioglobus sp.]|nr:hypothetical protein SPBRAN_187 [uncultured Candidatus Thioglobus sp.]